MHAATVGIPGTVFGGWESVKPIATVDFTKNAVTGRRRLIFASNNKISIHYIFLKSFTMIFLRFWVYPRCVV
jgi:hypothetical protein